VSDLDFSKILRDYDASMIVIHSDDSYRMVCDDYRERVKCFFKENAEHLKRMKRLKKIGAYIYSHEISCDSILHQTFRPHTHAIVFYPKGTHMPDLSPGMMPDRKLESHDNKMMKSDLEIYSCYMVSAYSLAALYEREFPGAGIVDFNRKTAEAFHFLIDMAKGNAGEKAYRRYGSTKIAKKKKN